MRTPRSSSSPTGRTPRRHPADWSPAPRRPGMTSPIRPRSSPRAPSDGPSPTAARALPEARGVPRRPAHPACWPLGLHVLGVVEVDIPAACVCEFGQHLAVHDGVGAGLVRRATLDGDVVGEVERPGSERHRDDRFGQRALRARPATPTSLGSPTLAPARPAPRWRRRRAACLRGGSVRSACRVRSARSAGGPRPCGRPKP